MNSFFELILYRLSHIGEIPLCNGAAYKAPHFFGICFPLCYRCTFIFLFFGIAMFIGYRYKKDISIWILLICLIPMIIDGGLQTFFEIESTNLRRAFTGGIFGFSMGIIVVKVQNYINLRL